MTSDAQPHAADLLGPSSTTLRRVSVALGERSYEVLIGEDLMKQHQLWAALIQGRQVALVTNETIAKLHAAKAV